jgi:hypothetical protein
MNSLHLHLMLNHLPVVGSLLGLGLWIAAAWRKSLELQKAGLVLFAGIALLTAPVYWSGEEAEDRAAQFPGVTEALLDPHEDAAGVAALGVALLGVSALGGLIWVRRDRLIPLGYAGVIGVLSLGTVAAMLVTANLGGQIRHPEIRKSTPHPGQWKPPVIEQRRE